MKSPIDDYLFWNNVSIQNFWNKKSHVKEDYYSFRHGKRISEIVLSTLHKNIKLSNIKICDYGCGPGYLIDHFLNKNIPTYGIDFSQESVAIMKSRLVNNKNFLGCSTFSDNEWRSLKFDLVIVSEVIEHLYDEDLRILLENVSSILSEGGAVIFTTPNNEILSQSIQFDNDLGKFIHKWQHVRSWTKNSLSGILNLNGFDVILASTLDFRYPKYTKVLQFIARFFLGKRLVLPNLLIKSKLK